MGRSDKNCPDKICPLILSEKTVNVNNQVKLKYTLEEYKKLEQNSWNADMGKCHKN